MATYNIYEAKTSFSRLVEEATRGEEVVIAKAGKPVLRMVPIVEEKKAGRREFGQNFLGVGSLYRASGYSMMTCHSICSRCCGMTMRAVRTDESYRGARTCLDTHVLIWLSSDLRANVRRRC